VRDTYKAVEVHEAGRLRIVERSISEPGAGQVHEFKDGKIIRTWHTEDWMSGLRQLGVFEK